MPSRTKGENHTHLTVQFVIMLVVAGVILTGVALTQIPGSRTVPYSSGAYLEIKLITYSGTSQNYTTPRIPYGSQITVNAFSGSSFLTPICSTSCPGAIEATLYTIVPSGAANWQTSNCYLLAELNGTSVQNVVCQSGGTGQVNQEIDVATLSVTGFQLRGLLQNGQKDLFTFQTGGSVTENLIGCSVSTCQTIGTWSPSLIATLEVVNSGGIIYAGVL
jgi:hypothetical protein